MDINGMNVFDYLSNHKPREVIHNLVKMIFKDKRLLEAIRWRLAYAYLGGHYRHNDELKSFLKDIPNLDSLIRIINLSVYDYHKFYKVVKGKSKDGITVQYLQKEYLLYIEKVCPMFPNNIEIENKERE